MMSRLMPSFCIMVAPVWAAFEFDRLPVATSADDKILALARDWLCGRTYEEKWRRLLRGARSGRAANNSHAQPHVRICHHFKLGDIMSDDLKNAGAQDRARINVHEAHEVAYWTKELGVTPDRLQQLVKKVGTSAKAVREELAAD
jgi:hypothetical protein